MSETFHVDTQFLRSALGVFENISAFEQAAGSRDPARRAANVATLIDALDLCNLIVLGDRIVFDSEVGGGRQQKIVEQIGRVGKSLGDARAEALFRGIFAGVAPRDEAVSWSLQLRAARDAAAFFTRLARCAANVLDLFHLPHEPPTDPGSNLLQFVEAKRKPTSQQLEELESKKQITGRRFYTAMLSEDTAFRALCEIRRQMVFTDEILAVLFMNFRLRLAEVRSIARQEVIIADDSGQKECTNALTYVPSMGRRDFTREFNRYVQWGTDAKTRHGHAFDLGLREYVLQEWEGIGCQVQLSERRTIPITIASIIGSSAVRQSPRPETLLVECLRWRQDCQDQILAIRQATHEFEALGEGERKQRAAAYAAEILKGSSTDAARNQALGERLALSDKWLGLGCRMFLNPFGALESLVIDSTDKVRQHFETVHSPEYVVATHLSEAARPLLLGVDPKLRQCLIDIFGGTVIDSRNPNYDPDRFAAMA